MVHTTCSWQPRAPGLSRDMTRGSAPGAGSGDNWPLCRQAAMATNIDKDLIREAYEEVRADNSETEWAVFKFEGTHIVVSAKGVGFEEFREQFKDDDRAFGYIRIQMGDEMSKRQKFLFLTWVGPAVGVIKRAKMSTDKAVIKDVIANFSVEIQLENLNEFNLEYFREQLVRAGGANYGTGMRDL
ncbi:coactosin-like protein isoform X2 [Bacillus rossius redtenbacheri]|uniref:coactosin-like protein isoform X2 n=1 Tax=Bacillus rossius redtenbacheri TaxID=93214 RepID=UPI002FDEEFFE